ncbi:MAG: hypothetical protein D6702_02240 [Planctomycetota bacterium]|nr:MAG: hypothetical protein D6702_02240 [Planctomycetota bacterium]
MHRLDLDDGATRVRLEFAGPLAGPRPQVFRCRADTSSCGFQARLDRVKILPDDLDRFLAAAAEVAAGDRPEAVLSALDPEDFMIRLRRQHDAVNVEGFLSRAYTDFRGWPRRHRLDFGLRLAPEVVAAELAAFAVGSAAAADA